MKRPVGLLIYIAVITALAALLARDALAGLA